MSCAEKVLSRTQSLPASMVTCTPRSLGVASAAVTLRPVPAQGRPHRVGSPLLVTVLSFMDIWSCVRSSRPSLQMLL